MQTLLPTLALMLWTQAQLGSGVLIGVLHDVNGKPLAGVRVALAEISETDGVPKPGAVLVSIATTDSRGVYRLEDVRPGRYHVVAGRVDKPTYYPGTLEPASAKVISISSASAIGGMDFTVIQESLQSPQPGVLRQPSIKRLPLVGSDVLSLIQTLPGVVSRIEPFTFTFEDVDGQSVKFSLPSGVRMSFACPGCSSLVWNTGVGSPRNTPGVLFQLKDGGKELEVTCRATYCDIFPAVPAPPRILYKDEMDVIPTSERTRFVVTP